MFIYYEIMPENCVQYLIQYNYNYKTLIKINNQNFGSVCINADLIL